MAFTKVVGAGIHTLSNITSHNINSSGIITATKFVGPIEGNITAVDATFTGNVSIAKTLTYEDVKNVDSVGLVTAREGVFVPDNKKLQVGNVAGSADLDIYHNGSNTYIDEVSADTLTITTGGTERLRIKSDGDVIIGTNDLESQLGSRRRLAVCDTTNGALLHLRGQSPAIFFDQSGGNIGKIYLDSADFAIYADTPNSEGTERLRINSAGDVGIGENSPDVRLHVTETFNTAYSLTSVTTDTNHLLKLENPSTTANAFAGMQFRVGSGADLYFGAIQQNTNAGDFYFANQDNPDVELMRIKSTGKVGIGTDNPISPLHLQSTSANQNVLTISANNGRTAHIKSPNVSDSNTPFTFYTNNAWRFDIDSIRVLTMTHDYKVGIKTDVPLSDFTVLTNGNGYFSVNGSGGNGAELLFHKKSDKSQTYSIQNNGGANELVQHVLASSSGQYSWYVGGQSASNLKTWSKTKSTKRKSSIFSTVSVRT